MLGEIRGLKAAKYQNEDRDMLLDVFMDDDGVHIVHADLDLEWYDEWIISPEGKVKQQFIDSTLPDVE